MQRREAMAAMAGAAALAASKASGAQAATGRTYRRIACEEAYTIPEIADALRELAGGIPTMRTGPFEGYFMDDLLDLGEGRIAQMDAAGIDVHILAVSAPGVQLFEPEQGLELAKLANDRLAEAIARHPDRFAGMATLAPQAAERSAQEFERAIKTLGFKGGMINSSTNNVYIDHPSARPLFEAAAAMDVPIYIHPSITPIEAGENMVPPGFTVGWNYGVEAGTNAIRLIGSGIFDDLPNLKIVLGHCGEFIPMVLDRLDNRYVWESNRRPVPKLKRKPSDYFRSNFVVTTSGSNYAGPVGLCIDQLGLENVLFGADFPFEDQPQTVIDLETAGLAEFQLRAIFDENPSRVFSIA